MGMWTAVRTRPHLHRLDDYDYYDEDCVALLHHLTGLIPRPPAPLRPNHKRKETDASVTLSFDGTVPNPPCPVTFSFELTRPHARRLQGFALRPAVEFPRRPSPGRTRLGFDPPMPVPAAMADDVRLPRWTSREPFVLQGGQPYPSLYGANADSLKRRPVPATSVGRTRPFTTRCGTSRYGSNAKACFSR